MGLGASLILFIGVVLTGWLYLKASSTTEQLRQFNAGRGQGRSDGSGESSRCEDYSDSWPAPSWSTLGLLILLLALHVVCPLLGVEDDNRWIIELLVGTPLAVFLVVYWVRQFLVERRLSGEMTSQAKQLANQQGPDAVRDFKAFRRTSAGLCAALSRQCRERGVVGESRRCPGS